MMSGFRYTSWTASVLFGTLATPLMAADLRVPQDYATIQQAIDVAASGDTVIVDAGSYAPIRFKGRAVRVYAPYGPSVTAIDGGGTSTAVKFVDGETAASVLEGFTIRNGRAPVGGGVYMNSASPTIRSCIFANNIASDRGGAVAAVNSRATYDNCSFTSNTATERGGALYLFVSSDTSFTNCYFVGNATRNRNAPSYGGAVAAESASDVTFVNCDFSGNTAQAEEDYTGAAFGGAVWLNAVAGVFTDCDFNSNSIVAKSGDGGGGAIYATGVSTIDGCSFTTNTVTIPTTGNASGGAVHLTSATSPLSASFVENSINGGGSASGGALVVSSGKSLAIDGCSFSGNSIANATSASGGAAVISVGTTSASEAQFSANRIQTTTGSASGGALFANGNLTATNLSATGNTVTSNSRSASGGAFYLEGTATLIGSTISSSQVTAYQNATGGGLVANSVILDGSSITSSRLTSIDNQYYNSWTARGAGVDCSVLAAENCTFTDNDILGGSQAFGAGIYAGEVQLTDCTISGSSTSGNGRAEGSGIYASNTATMTRTTIRDCTLAGTSGDIRGSGAYIGGPSQWTDCSIENNSATSGAIGVGIYTNADTQLRFVTVRSNAVQGSNGGTAAGARIYGACIVEDCIFENNRASTEGNAGSTGGLRWVYANGAAIRRTTFANNTGGYGAGGALISLANNSQDLIVENCIFQDNLVNGGYGGGLSVESGRDLSMSGTRFIRNYTAYDGGAINAPEIQSFSLATCEFSDCSASNRGGAINAPNARITVADTVLARCAGPESGGAIYCKSFESIRNTDFTECRSRNQGGAVCTHGNIANGDITDCTFTDCQSGQIGQPNSSGDGGAIRAQYTIGSITRCTFTRCTAFGGAAIGGGISSGSILELRDCAFTDCSATSNNSNYAYGGAIYATTTTSDISIGPIHGTTFTRCGVSGNGCRGGAILCGNMGAITNSHWTDCRSIGVGSSYGGAIDASKIASIADSSFTRCEATATSTAAIAQGGAIRATTYSTSIGPIDRTTFNDNRAEVAGLSNSSQAYGGAIWSYDLAVLTDCAFTGNTCSANDCGGGAVHMYDGSFVTCDFAGNSATSLAGSALGGAVWAYSTESTWLASFDHCDFLANSIDGNIANGGAIYQQYGDVRCNDSTFVACGARDGGAIWFYATDASRGAVITRCEFTKCSASRGAGIYGSAAAQLAVVDSAFAQNLAFDDGGAIYANGYNPQTGSFKIQQSTFAGNIATRGGALRVGRHSSSNAFTYPITASVFSGNIAVTGGAIINDDGESSKPIVSTSIFCSNAPDNIVGTWQDAGGNSFGGSADCNDNGVCDSVDLALGVAEDCNGNGILDGCEIAAGKNDVNGDGIPDSCQCFGDLNDNGTVDGADLAALLGAWGQTQAGSAADINGDGNIDAADLTFLLANWGPCN